MNHWFDAFENGATCGLQITSLPSATTLAEAWNLLPKKGQGWVCLADQVCRFDPSQRTGLLLHAEVASGSTTIILRHDNSQWRAWRWEELPKATDHRVIRQVYLSSAPKWNHSIPQMEMATYWKRQEDAGLQIWQPVGSRFCGWKEET